MTGYEDDLPNTIGPYRIVRPLGEGGMAIVFLAEQTRPITRQVALKILKPGMDSAQIISRFESERQALAVLDHPNIAKIHDGGVADNGRPYFVMEFVDGLPITTFCDQHRLNVRRRLNLMIDVCRAVQHAHLKGLIHRDLKPSNILVTEVDGNPQPMVIDFGISKSIDASRDSDGNTTRLGQLVGTPQYMSPEQTGIDGQDIDSRADVFSLGVVLYELLTGLLPIDFDGVRDIAVPAVVREKVPLKPSSRLTAHDAGFSEMAASRDTNPDNLVRRLRGDLDRIVMKALEKNRDRRYETANALASDCLNYLSHKPVSARPPGAGYLLRRFVQRNLWQVGAGVVALVALVGGGIAATVGYVRATEAEVIARREAATAAQVSGFLIDLFRSSDPNVARGADPTASELLTSGRQSVNDALAGQPLIQARLRSTIGFVYRNLGQYEEAETLLKEALDVQLELVGRSHPDTLKSMNRLGTIQMDMGKYDAARQTLTEALTGQSDVLGPDHVDTLMTMNNLAVLQRITGNHDEAETLYRRALDGQKRTLGVDHVETLRSMNNLAELYSVTGDYRQAERLFVQTNQAQNRVLGPDHPSSLRSARNLANLYRNQERFEEAEAIFSYVLPRSRRVLGEDHSDTLATIQNLANVYRRLGQYEEAEPLYVKAVAGYQRVMGGLHEDTIAVKSNLAELYREQGRFDEAEPVYREALSAQSEINPNHANTGVYHHNLACLYRDTGRHDQSVPHFEEAHRVWTALLRPDHPYLIENYKQWAELKRRMRDSDGAAALEARIDELTGIRRGN